MIGDYLGFPIDDNLCSPEKIGQFAIIKKIGQGGMGVVFEARESETGEAVAIKILKYNLAPDTEAIQRFHREITASQALSHPNIIPVLAVGEIEGTHYYVMPLLKGESLAECLRRKRMEIEEAVRIAIEIALALAHAHSRGIVHRDIKPANIMLEKERVLVTDFGLARPEWLARLTTTGMVVGTPVYMSPEQACGLSELDHRTDIYSLGVTLYEMLTGTMPFHANNIPQLLDKISKHLALAPKKLNRQISDNLDYIVQRAMAKQPAMRYQNAEDMAEDLRRCLYHLPLQRQSRIARYRFPALIVGVGLTFFLLTILFCTLAHWLGPANASNLPQKKATLAPAIPNTFRYVLSRQPPAQNWLRKMLPSNSNKNKPPK